MQLPNVAGQIQPAHSTFVCQTLIINKGPICTCVCVCEGQFPHKQMLVLKIVKILVKLKKLGLIL